MSTCDVIIPVYNGKEVVQRCLEALSDQEIPSGWRVRVIVSDDGSTDGFLSSSPQGELSKNMIVTLIKNPHRGTAAARNAAIEQSQADIILFLGADILLRPGAVAAHLAFHTAYSDTVAAAVGMVRWDPRLTPSPFMEWMVHGGSQNNFDDLLGVSTADPRHFFYGSHISVKRLFLGKARFSTEYRGYGWEDLDLGHQLRCQGMRLYVLHNAVGLHRHRYSVSDIYRRQRAAGSAVSIFQRRCGLAPSACRLTLRRRVKLVLFRWSGLRSVLHFVLRFSAEHWSTPHLFLIATSAEYWLGLDDRSRNVREGA